MKARVLFLLKKPNVENSYGTTQNGLWISAQMLSKMINRDLGVPAACAQVVDADSIEHALHIYTDTSVRNVVVLEALWVTPEKLRELTSLYPNIVWVVRIHSNTPFLAIEGNAIQWIDEYQSIPNVYVGCVGSDLLVELQGLGPMKFLPNYYDLSKSKSPKLISPRPACWDLGHLAIGCFGAIRPMKNQLHQALAAIQYAEMNGWTLDFYINNHVEWGGQGVLENLRSTFIALGPSYRLIELPWLPHAKFVEIVSKMDLNMQVSMSETFNLVTADSVSVGVPVVVSNTVRWVSSDFKADPNDMDSILNCMSKALKCWTGPWRNYRALKRVNEVAIEEWREMLRGFDIEGDTSIRAAIPRRSLRLAVA